MRLPTEPNWPSIIERIQKRGLTQQDIERRTGVKQGTVSIMKRGLNKHASYVSGTAIMKLWKSLRDKKNGVEK